MKQAILKATVTAACLCAMPWAHSATTSKDEYKATKDRISSDYKVDKAACDKMSGNAKDICVEEAKAKEKVAKAQAEYDHTGKANDRAKIAEVKAETDYDVAKQRCDDKSGNEKDVCVKEAKAAEVKAKSEAKLAKKVQNESMDTVQDIKDANYKVAAEKCDALSGSAKDSCVDKAKAHYGKK